MVAVLKMPRYLPTEPWSDRRTFARKEYHTTVQGHRLDHTIQARQEPRLSLALRDLSLGGLSAITDLPLGSQRSTRPSGLGYRVALEFDPLPAA